MRFKLIVYGNKLYKETVIPEDAENIVVGTCKEAQIRLPENFFYEGFGVELKKQGEKYALVCQDGYYILNEQGNKEFIHECNPGDRVGICHKDTDIVVLKLDFSIDFGSEQSDYSFQINLGDTSVITIGGANSDICITNELIADDKCTLHRTDHGYQVDTSHLRFGAFINGIGHKGRMVLLEDQQFLSIYGISFYLCDHKLYTTSDGHVTTHLSGLVRREQDNQFKYPEFIKNVRLQYKQPTKKLEVIPPSSAPTKQSIMALMSMLPMLTMVIIMILMRNAMYGGGGGNAFMIMYMIMYGMTAAISIITFIVNRKKFREDSRKRIANYNKYILKKENDIQQEREEERVIAEKMNIMPSEMVSQIEHFDARLFEKAKNHDDYLDVPIGRGTIQAFNQVDYRAQESLDLEDPMMQYPEELHDKYETIENMPIALHLKDLNAIGFVGNRSKLLNMARNMIITLAGQHFYNDVKFYLLLEEGDVKDFTWARWLQNFQEGSRRNIMYDIDSKKIVLDAIYNDLSERDSNEDQPASEKKEKPTRIVFAYRSKALTEHPITEYVKNASKLGFTFIFFEEYLELLHEACDQVIYLDGADNKGFIQTADDAVNMQGFEYEVVGEDQIKAAAIKLAPVHVNEISLESTLTKNITFYQLYDILTAYDLNVGARWNSAKIYESMAVPIGVDSSGAKVCLDIHERGHGPHGLVAGTTGAGKSELLQTYVLSMCTHFHPYEVGFIIIDFKGGGMANQFKDLPHLNGAITNIDGKQVDRSLMSIKAELMKRQRLFAEAGVNAIDNYIALYKKGQVKIPLPHLILIVDEFAELKSDQPDFMKELISAARIGRSLGVHLILATQKPSGVVNDQIWSNSRFKLCLKVQDKSDSQEVLKSPLAAEIREPGRCYMEVGNHELFQLLQSAYSGAPAGVGAVDKTTKFDLSFVDMVGRRKVFYHQEPSKEEATQSQLEAIVDYIADYCQENHIEKLPPICLPPLEQEIPYPDQTNIIYEDSDICVPIGIYDDPENQVQDTVSLNLTKDNTFIIGSALMGKTNLCQTIIRGITDRYGVDEVSIYIVDFASMILRNFSSLAYVGGVITLKDETMLKQFLLMIQAQISERQKIFADMGLSSFSAYRDAGLKDLTQTVIIFENYSVFRSAYEDLEDAFMDICRDGIAVGVSTIITNPTATGIGFKLLTNFGRKIAFYCNDSSQYDSLFDRCRTQPDDNAGRAITNMDGQIREFQTYLSFEAVKEVEKIDKIRGYVAEVNAKCGDLHAYRVPTIPEYVTENYMEDHYGSQTDKLAEYQIPVGISYATIDPLYINLLKSPLIGMLGNNESGRIGYLKYMLTMLERNKNISPSKVYIVDEVSRDLEFAKNFEIVESYSYVASNVISIIQEVCTEVGSRYDEMADSPESLDSKPMLIILINTPLASDMIASDMQAMKMFDIIVNKLKGYKACIMHTNMENTAITYKSDDVLKQLSEYGSHLVFEQASQIRALDLPPMFVRNNPKKLENGDAFYIENGTVCKVRTIVPD